MADNQPIRITYTQVALVLIIIAILLLLAAKPLYLINEGEQAVVVGEGIGKKKEINEIKK